MRCDSGHQMSINSDSCINARILPMHYSINNQQFTIQMGQNYDLYDYLFHIITHILLSCHALRGRACCNWLYPVIAEHYGNP